MRVTGQVERSEAAPVRLGFEVSRAGTTARVAGRPAETLAELSRVFAVQVIEPGIHRLVEEGGYRRRRWLDWAVFHVEPQFIDTWVRYTRALKQRNAALKSDSSQAGIWDPELSRLGELIAESRRTFLERLQPYWREAVAALSGLDVELHYLRGWNLEQSLEEALVASRARDELRQLTHSGPHRADVAVRLHGRPAREVLSRGQQKLVAVAMTLAQLRLLQDQTQTTPTLLLDDPGAELDGERLERFIGEVLKLRCQLVVTSLHSESRLFGTPDRTFRVVQGRVQSV
jgi:DNA replication and repair protein RecF